MSPAQVLERCYDTLKWRLMNGVFPSGQRLEAARLADDIHVSVTPVRDVLNRLTGEKLVVSVPGDGFYVPTLDEGALRDLLDWNMHLALHALHSGENSNHQLVAEDGGLSDIVDRADLFFRSLTAGLENGEFIRAMDSVSDRLHTMRMHDQTVLGGTEEELNAMEKAFATGDIRETAKRIRIYHHRRRAKLTAYMRHLRA